MVASYNDPLGGIPSTVGTQFRTDYYYKKALVEAAKESYFGQLANVRAMPKNMGKTIRQFHYMPILDDRNINDQGIDAAGVIGTNAGADFEVNIEVQLPDAQGNIPGSVGYRGISKYFPGTSTVSAAAATTAAELDVLNYLNQQGIIPATNTYAVITVTGAGSAFDLGYRFVVHTAVSNTGNLYGSSKDIGTILGKIPALSEQGGRVNRVGMTRIDIEGTIEKLGFFDEYSQELLDFDTDSQLLMHITTESVKAANEITEDVLQIDLLNGAGVIRYTGNATSTATLAGGTTLAGNPATDGDVVTYDDLVKLSIELDNNRCPKKTELISGSRMIDTRTVNSARYMYIGSEMIPTIMRMSDYHGNKAFIPVASYAQAGAPARGEFGAVDNFRFIVVPEMHFWEAAGATVATPTGELFRYAADAAGVSKYNVYPLLVVGEGSFTTIGFQTDGKSVKFTIEHRRPKDNIRPENPFGETGFYSIKWYYGTMILRPERLALIKTVAEI